MELLEVVLGVLLTGALGLAIILGVELYRENKVEDKKDE